MHGDQQLCVFEEIIFIPEFTTYKIINSPFLRQCRDVNDAFSCSVIYKIQEKWAVSLSYRLTALADWFSALKNGAINDDTLAEMKRLTECVIGETVK